MSYIVSDKNQARLENAVVEIRSTKSNLICPYATPIETLRLVTDENGNFSSPGFCIQYDDELEITVSYPDCKQERFTVDYALFLASPYETYPADQETGMRIGLFDCDLD